MNAKLNIIYNDHPQNLTETASSQRMKYMEDPKTAVTTLVTIDMDGSMKKSRLFEAIES